MTADEARGPALDRGWSRVGPGKSASSSQRSRMSSRSGQLAASAPGRGGSIGRPVSAVWRITDGGSGAAVGDLAMWPAGRGPGPAVLGHRVSFAGRALRAAAGRGDER